jgi:[protein-PII] uridylyltransferase
LFSSREKQKKLKTVLQSLAVDELQSFRIVRQKSLIGDRRAVFEVPSRVRFDNEVSSAFTLLEVKGRDKIGFLHELAQVLVRHGCAIFNAHVATFGDRAVDVFYLQDQDGEKILDPKKLEKMEAALRQAIAGKKP